MTGLVAELVGLVLAAACLVPCALIVGWLRDDTLRPAPPARFAPVTARTRFTYARPTPAHWHHRALLEQQWLAPVTVIGRPPAAPAPVFAHAA